jgi:hypothetical protein
VRSSIANWLEARSLTATFEVEKLRWIPTDKDPNTLWLALDLRFISQGTDQEQENERFLRTLQQFQQVYHGSFPESLFFKLVHAGGIKPAEARVAIMVVEDTFVVAREPGSGELRFEHASPRQVRRQVELPAATAAGAAAPGPQATAPAALQSPSLEGEVQRYLEDFFAARNRDARRAAPQLTRKPFEPDYVGIDVAGIRNVVISRSDYWESLQISIQITNTPQGRRAVCYLDGGYAPGLGQRLPARGGYTDFATRHQADLEQFADQLMRGLQDHLLRSAR